MIMVGRKCTLITLSTNHDHSIKKNTK